jgi:hypothetical protein
MAGEQILRGIRDNVDLSLSNKFSTYSMVKPGGDLKTILESANSAAESLTLKDVIVICGGSNDFDLDEIEPTTDYIREFIKTYNHTNIVLTKVPIRYDLSYYSHINKGIRSFNRKLLEIAAEHKQITLIEIDMDRKYHTQHGLHFNKSGKLLFSNKITQAIYSILNKKPKQKVEMNENFESRGDVNKTNRSCKQGQEELSNIEKINKLVQLDVSKNSEGKPAQNNQETKSDNDEDKHSDGKYSQTNNEVVLSRDTQRDDEKENSQDNDSNLTSNNCLTNGDQRAVRLNKTYG